MHAVITSGGDVGPTFARAIGSPRKALAPLGVRRLIDPAIDAARSIGVTGLAVVAPPDVAAYCAARVDRIVDSANDGADNIGRALGAFPSAERLIFLTCDLPFIDGSSLAAFVERSRVAAVTMALSPAAMYEAEFPAAPPHAVTLGGERYANGSVFMIDRSAFTAVERVAGRFFEARKSLPRLAALLGPALCLRFALGRLRLEHIEARAGGVLGVRAHAVRDAAPGLCYDVTTSPTGPTRTRWHRRHMGKRSEAFPYARTAALWLGLQFVWGAILAVSLQARSVALAPHDGLRAYGVIAALGAIVGTITQLAIGPLADSRFLRTGARREFYLGGTAIAVPAIAWFYLAPDYPQCVAAFFALQFGMNVVTGPYAAIIPDYVAAERAGSAASWMGTFQSIGNAGGLLVAGFISGTASVALVLIVTLSIACLITTYATFAITPRRATSQRFAFGRDFRTLCASRMAINLGFYTLLGFLFFFVEQSLKTPAADVRVRTALLFLTFTLANVAGASIAAKPADRYDKRAVVLAANAIVAAGLLMLALARDAGFAFVAAIAGIAWGAYFITDWALACAILPRGAMASSMGIWNVAATLPQILVPALTTPIVEGVNRTFPGDGPRAAVGLAIIEFTVGALWLYRLPKQGAVTQTR